MPFDAVALPMRGMVVFPGMLRIVAAGRPSSIQAVLRHVEEGEPLVLVPQLDSDEEDPLTARISAVGVLGQVMRLTRLPDGELRLLIEGNERVRLVTPLRLEGGATCTSVEPRPAVVRDAIRVSAMASASQIEDDALRVFDALLDADEEGYRLAAVDDAVVV